MDIDEHFGYEKDASGRRVTLGTGLSGNTYLGWVSIRQQDTQDGTLPESVRIPAALKCFSASAADADDRAQGRLKREVMIHGRLRHPNIVRFLRYFHDRHTPVIATEYVEGQTLEKAVAAAVQQGRINTEDWLKDVLDWAVQLCWALEYLESARILHRDIKPANIIIETEGSKPVLLDFGIGRSFDPKENRAGQRPQTESGFVGTYAFASPEQFTQALPSNLDEVTDISLRTDIYSLAATIMYALLPHLLDHTLNGPARRIDFAAHTDRLPGISGLRELMACMLSADPLKRPAPRAAAHDFEKILRVNFGVSVMRPTGSDPPPPPTELELPGFIALGDGSEIAATLLSHYAYSYWHRRDDASIELAEQRPVERLKYDEALDLVRCINEGTKDEPWTYRLPTISEWFLAAGFPLSGGQASTSRQTRRLMLDHGAELEWCHESERSDVYPECHKLCYLGTSGPQTCDRHRQWPKGAVRLVRKSRITRQD